ncbi:MAG: hypothetical protein U9Q66_03165 [Patescibacteria group bacterium]|nr:hypothetical protein [Patescibacteria group bacterium]
MRTGLVGLNQIDVLKINRALYISNYSKKFKIKMMDFLIDLDLKSEENELNLNNPELIIEFRDNLLDFQSNYASTNIVEFFSHFIEKT